MPSAGTGLFSATSQALSRPPAPGRPWLPQQSDLWQLGADFVFDAEGNLTMAHRCRSSHDRPPAAAVIGAFRKAAPALKRKQ